MAGGAVIRKRWVGESASRGPGLGSSTENRRQRPADGCGKLAAMAVFGATDESTRGDRSGSAAEWGGPPLRRSGTVRPVSAGREVVRTLFPSLRIRGVFDVGPIREPSPTSASSSRATRHISPKYSGPHLPSASMTLTRATPLAEPFPDRRAVAAVLLEDDRLDLVEAPGDLHRPVGRPIV